MQTQETTLLHYVELKLINAAAAVMCKVSENVENVQEVFSLHCFNAWLHFGEMNVGLCMLVSVSEQGFTNTWHQHSSSTRPDKHKCVDSTEY